MGNCFSKPVMEEFDEPATKYRDGKKRGKENKGCHANKQGTQCREAEVAPEKKEKCRVGVEPLKKT